MTQTRPHFLPILFDEPHPGQEWTAGIDGEPKSIRHTASISVATNPGSVHNIRILYEGVWEKIAGERDNGRNESAVPTKTGPT